MSRKVSQATPAHLLHLQTYSLVYFTCSRTSATTKACDAIHDELQDMLRQGQLGVSTQAQLYLLWLQSLWLYLLWLHSSRRLGAGAAAPLGRTLTKGYPVPTCAPAYLCSATALLNDTQVRLLQSIKERHAALAKLL